MTLLGAAPSWRRAQGAFDLTLGRYGHRDLVARGWELRGSVATHDATYVALAEALSATLLTADARLARAPGPQCPIEVVR